MTLPLDTNAIRAEADAATPGPWRLQIAACDHPDADNHSAIKGDGALVVACVEDANARFIVTARFVVPALCDALDEARATLANERGEGEAPGEGWEWTNCGGWGYAWVTGGDDPSAWMAVAHKPAAGWYIRLGADYAHLYPQLGVTHPTARAAMIAADKARSPG